LEAVTIADLTVSIVWVSQIADLTLSILSYRWVQIARCHRSGHINRDRSDHRSGSINLLPIYGPIADLTVSPSLL